MFAEKEEGIGSDSVGRHTGVRVMPVQPSGGGHGRAQGIVVFHLQCGDQFGWMA